MTSYRNYHGQLFNQFEQALQTVCIEREIPILPMAWENLVDEFYNHYVYFGSEIYKYEWDGELDEDELSVEEILLKLRATKTPFKKKLSLLDHFMDTKMTEFSVFINFSDPYDCDDCGSSPINTRVTASLNDDDYWEMEQSYGCYGGDSFHGEKEDCIARVRENLTRLILNDSAFSKSDKKEVRKFLSDLEKFECVIPYDLPTY